MHQRLANLKWTAGLALANPLNLFFTYAAINQMPLGGLLESGLPTTWDLQTYVLTLWPGFIVFFPALLLLNVVTNSEYTIQLAITHYFMSAFIVAVAIPFIMAFLVYFTQ